MRFQVPGVPAGAAVTAFAPHLNRMAGSGAQMYKGGVSGQPGTRAVPAPVTDTQMHQDTGDLAQAGTARSSDAPSAWYPQLWHERSLNGDGTMGYVTPVRVYSDNLMPVPAVDPRGIPARLSRRITQRGGRQIGQPRVIPTWGNGG